MSSNYPSSHWSIQKELGSNLPKFDLDPSSGTKFEEIETGVHLFTNPNATGQTIMLSGILHGDEDAGANIMDKLRSELCDGTIDLKRNVIFVDGNLRAAHEARNTKDSKPGDHRYYSKDKPLGIEANANRLWTIDDLKKEYESYAGKRRRIIASAINDILSGGADASEVRATLEHHDLHQSFKVPKVKDVRGNHTDDSEYTYGMVYDSLQFFKEQFSSVYAGLVLSDPATAQTFAGYTARELNATAITAELGTIGHPDHLTYADKLLDAFRQILQGMEPAVAQTPPDTWKPIEAIIRKPGVENFAFYNADQAPELLIGKPIEPPVDFIEAKNLIAIPRQDGHYLIQPGQAVLFANDQVTTGDRAGLIIEKLAA